MKLRYFLALLIVFWIAGVIAFYYVVHKPWAGEQAIALFRAGQDILVSLALVSLAGGLGRKLCSLRWLAGILEQAAPLERPALCAAVGLGAMSLGVLAAGLAGGLLFWVALLALVAGLILLRRHVAAWLGDLRSGVFYPNGVLDRPISGAGALSGLEKFIAAFVLLVIFLNLLRALAPPLKWDSLVYHLQIPRAYLTAGRIFFYPENFYAGFPQAVELLFTWAMALDLTSHIASDTAAAVFGWMVSLLAFISVEGFARRVLNPGVRWLAPAILLCGYSISQAMNWAYLELWVLLFGTVMLSALDHYLRIGSGALYRNGVLDRNRSWLLITGLMLGFAISIKYTAGALLVIAAVMLLVRGSAPFRETKLTGLTGLARNWLVEMVIIGGVAALLVLPWLLKNWLLIGNPLYPIISFGGQIDPWQQTFRSGLPPQRTLLQDILLPLQATFFGIEGGLVEGTPEYGASLGPLLLALIPGLLLGWKTWADDQRRTLRRLLIATGVAWLLWSILAHFADELMRPRHWFGVFGGLALLAAAGFQSASAVRFPTLRLGRLLSALLILALTLAALNEATQFSRANPLPVILGSQSKDEYLDQQLGWYSLAMRAANDLPTDSVVLFLWEPRTFYCRGFFIRRTDVYQQAVCLPDGKLDNWGYLLQAGGDSAGVAELLQQKSVTHVLLHDAGLSWIRQASGDSDPVSWVELDNFRRDDLRLLQRFGDSYTLYEFTEGGQE